MSLIPFRSCLRQQKNLTICLPALIDKCQRSSVVAVKVIRFHIKLVEVLLNADPDLRVIHLVRDPRGMLQSWKEVSVPRLTNEGLRISANIACQRMLADVVTRLRLETKFPGRIMLVRYEDLARDSDLVLNEVYEKLLQQPVPVGVKRRVSGQINAAANDGRFNTKRKNGTAAAYSWKRKIDRTFLEYVNTKCGEVLSLTRYNEN